MAINPGSGSTPPAAGLGSGKGPPFQLQAVAPETASPFQPEASSHGNGSPFHPAAVVTEMVTLSGSALPVAMPSSSSSGPGNGFALPGVPPCSPVAPEMALPFRLPRMQSRCEVLLGCRPVCLPYTTTAQGGAQTTPSQRRKGSGLRSSFARHPGRPPDARSLSMARTGRRHGQAVSGATASSETGRAKPFPGPLPETGRADRFHCQTPQLEG